jgi:hypothetical protein
MNYMLKSMPLFTSLDKHAVFDATMFGYFYNSISKYKNIHVESSIPRHEQDSKW